MVNKQAALWQKPIAKCGQGVSTVWMGSGAKLADATTAWRERFKHKTFIVSGNQL
jgi:hypothetical protein